MLNLYIYAALSLFNVVFNLLDMSSCFRYTQRLIQKSTVSVSVLVKQHPGPCKRRQ